ncbi:PDCD10 and GCKIII kinases-associated protein 1 [Discoglossus pictus]
MGCNCCRMVKSSTFEPEETQSNGYVNEGHSYTSSELDCSKTQTIKISDLHDDLRRIEHDRFSGSQDFYNDSEKDNVKADEMASNAINTYTSPYPVLHFNINGEISHNIDNPRELPYPMNGNGTWSSEDTILKLAAEQPECVQQEFYEANEVTQENSLTESAILDIQNGNVTLEQYGCISEKDNHGLHSLTSNKEPYTRATENLVAQMIQRNSLRDMKRQSQDKYFIGDDEVDADVAEALAALAAAIAGEDFEDN